jgi:hypothetical protein
VFVDVSLNGSPPSTLTGVAQTQMFIPEPTSIALMCLGLTSLMFRSRNNRQEISG